MCNTINNLRVYLELNFGGKRELNATHLFVDMKYYLFIKFRVSFEPLTHEYGL